MRSRIPYPPGFVVAVLIQLLVIFIPANCWAAETPPQNTTTKLTASVWEHKDRLTGLTGARSLVEESGFDVVEFSPKKSPFEFGVDLIVFGSFISEHPAYPRYIKRFGDELLEFVERGGVFIQLTQDKAVEPTPAILPPGCSTTRSDVHFRKLISDDPAPLLVEGLTFKVHHGLEFPLTGHPLVGACMNTFRRQEGFYVGLWCDTQIRYGLPALLEAAHGRGRIILTALFLDKLYDDQGNTAVSESFRYAAGTFFRNLAVHVGQVRDRTAPEPVPSRFDPPPPAIVNKDAWSLVVLPDTQLYTQDHPELFEAQTRWIVRNKDSRDIRYVIHLGDVTHGNKPEQWRVARRSMKVLEGKVPFTITTGNHDYLQPGFVYALSDRSTLLNKYFPPRAHGQAFGPEGLYEADRLENNYHLFSAGGRDWIIISMEWLPRDEVVAWAGKLLEQYDSRSAILVTHEYLNEDNTRIPMMAELRASHPVLMELNSAEDLWNDLAGRYPNVVLVLSGHVTGDGAGYAVASGVHGNPVHEMMVNFQMRLDGGEGYLRLLEFQPDGRTVQVRTYSPVLDRHMSWPEHQFTFELPPEDLSQHPRRQ